MEHEHFYTEKAFMMNRIGMINLQSAGYVAFKQSFSVFKNKAYLKLIH